MASGSGDRSGEDTTKGSPSETEKQPETQTTAATGIDKAGSAVDEKAAEEEESSRQESALAGWTILRPLRMRGKGSRTGGSKTNGTDANVSSDEGPIGMDGMNNHELKVTESSGSDERREEDALSDLRSDDELLADDEENARPRATMSTETRLTVESSSGNDSGSEVEYKVYKRRWFGMIQLVLLNIIVSWDWLSFSATSTTCAEFYNVSASDINWLSTAFLFAFVVASPVVIYTLHRGGPKPSIIAASVLILLGNWIRYGATRAGPHGKFGGVMFGQILTGLAQPFVLSAPTRYSDLWFTNKGRVAATAVMSLANPFGGAIAQLVQPLWSTAPDQVPKSILWITIISTIACVPSFFIPSEPPTPCSPSSSVKKEPLKQSLKYLFAQPEFYLVMVPFTFYIGLFNSISSIINQVLQPYGFSETQAGIAGALLIVVGLVASAITSPVIDKTKSFLLAIKIQVPILGLSYLAFTWAPQTRSQAAPYAILAIMGSASFSLIPIVLEYMIELTHPVSPEVTSTICWSGGQLLGGIFILISDALRAPGVNDGSADNGTALPPGNMWRALVFQTVMGLIVVPLPLALGCCGRSKAVRMRRVEIDKEDVARREAEHTTVENTVANTTTT